MSDCIEWRRARNRDGYGMQWHKGSMWLAHRVVMARLLGEDAIVGKAVMHTCDNPPCVNPDHLVVGTWAENNADMADKGRASKGTARSNAKLTEDDVRAIRASYATGDTSISKLALAYGVSFGVTWRIIHHQTWKHVS